MHCGSHHHVEVDINSAPLCPPYEDLRNTQPEHGIPLHSYNYVYTCEVTGKHWPAWSQAFQIHRA